MTTRLVRRARRGLMAAAGAVLIAAGMVAAPAAGGAIVDDDATIDEPDLSTSSSIEVPGELDPVISEVKGLTGSTITTTSTTTTSPTTTTTVPETTTTTAPPPESEGNREEADEDSGSRQQAEPDPLHDLEIPVIDIEELKADYTRTEFPAYTPRFGKRSTLSIIELLEEHDVALDTQARVLAPFPVNGPASYTDDWGAARFTPTFHLHEGIDIFARGGTPVIASADATVTRAAYGEGAGGNVVYLTMADGTYLYYAHLEEISPLIHAGMSVEAGTVLGTVGDSGNAAGTPPHLHFEIHPGGGDAVPPAPYVDSWLADAMEEAEALVANLPTAEPAAPPVPPVIPAQVEPTQRAGVSSFPSEGEWDTAAVQWLMILVPAGALWWWRKRRTMAPASSGTIDGGSSDRDLNHASS